MSNNNEIPTLLWAIALAVSCCGPHLEDDQGAEAEGPDEAAPSCEESACPLSCGTRSCAGALGIGWCIDGKCSPRPMECVIASRPEQTCAEVCASVDAGVICVENGCEGATAFGYPGPEHLALGYCGESTPDVKAAVVPIEGPCDAPLLFSGSESFALYQCCCDHPDY